MKTLIPLLSAAAVTLCLLSCGKSAAPEYSGSPLPGGMLTINLTQDEATKANYANRQDSQINSYQIFVFDSAGKMETDYFTEVSHSNLPISVKIATFTGAKTVYALINHARMTLAQDFTLSAYEELLSDLSENTLTNLVMSGKNQITVTEYDKNKNSTASPQNLTIYVKRLSAMIVLEKMTVDFTGTSLEGATFTIQELYLKNVVGKAHMGLNGLTSTKNSEVAFKPLTDAEHTNYAYWYNKKTKQAGAPAVTVDVWNGSCPNVSGGSGNALNRCLFAYPNRTAGDSHNDTFDQRKTRLVVKAKVQKADVTTGTNGVDTFYVFDLPALEANRVYRISNVLITMLGKDDDNNDDDLQAGKITPFVSVDDWTETTTLTYEF